MKILSLSDTHGHKPSGLPEADVFVHAGDWSSYGSEKETIAFLKWLADIEHKFGEIIVVPGNHERWPFAHPDIAKSMFEQQGYHFLEDKAVVIGGKKFYGMPWTPVFGQWGYMAQLQARIERAANIPSDTNVLITHGPPHKIMDGVENFDGRKCEWEILHCGCMPLRDRVFEIKPQLHIFGHIHEGYGVEEHEGIKFVNASIMDKRYRPVNAFRLLEIP